MAAEESSQGAALGPEFSEDLGGDDSSRPSSPDPHEVLHEFMEALCGIEVLSGFMWKRMEDQDSAVNACTIVLKQGYERLETVYRHLDEALVGIPRSFPLDDVGGEDDDEDDADGKVPEPGGGGEAARDTDRRAHKAGVNRSVNAHAVESPIVLHPSNEKRTDGERDRMRDVRSLLACARCALLHDDAIDVSAVVSLAHDTLHDIINRLAVPSSTPP